MKQLWKNRYNHLAPCCKQYLIDRLNEHGYDKDKKLAGSVKFTCEKGHLVKMTYGQWVYPEGIEYCVACEEVQ